MKMFYPPGASTVAARVLPLKNCRNGMSGFSAGRPVATGGGQPRPEWTMIDKTVVEDGLVGKVGKET